MKRMKKMLAWLLTVAMVMSMMVLPVGASDDFTVSVSNGTANAGGTVTLDLSVSNNVEMSSLTVRVYYKSDVLNCSLVNPRVASTGATTAWWTYKDYCENTYFTAPNVQPNPNDTANIPAERAAAGWKMASIGYTAHTSENFKANGVIASLTFAVDSTAESCETPIEVEVVKATGASNATLTTAAVNGKITVNGALPTINTVTLASSTVNVAGGSAAAQTVQASAASVKGTDITNGVIWSVSPEGKGVTIGADGKISVTAMAEEGNYTITAAQKSGASQGASKTATLQVVRAASVPTTITVSGGQSSIIVPDDDATEDNVSTAFTAEVKDQFGAVITPAISWLILDGDDPVTGVNITSDGVVTVSKIAKTPITDAIGKTLTVKAKVDTISDTATITVKRAAPKLKVFMVEGADTLAVPTAAARTASATYTVANGWDQYAAEYSLAGKAVTWDFETTTGVVLSNGILTAEPSDTAGSVEISAQIEGVTAVKNVAITKAASAATSIKVFKQTGSGEPAELTGNTDTVIIPTSDTANTYKYTAQLYDQYGAEMAGDVVLTFVTADEKVTYSSGTVTVSKGATKDKTYTLTASYTDVADVVITITAKDIDITAPTVTPNAATYGMKWSEIIPDSKIVGGSASLNGVTVAGDFYLKNDGNAYPEAGAQAYEIWFKSTDGNYDLKVLGGSVNVGKAQITVTLGTIEKVYGEAVDLSGLNSTVTSGAPVAGDTAAAIQIIPACTADETTPVGSVEITGAATAETAVNYNVTVIPGTLTITKRPVTVTAGDLVISKAYDATTSAGTAESGELGLSGIVNSDDVSVSYTTVGAYADANVGTGKAVTISGLSLSGTDAGNYSISATQQQINSGKITKANLTAAMLQFTPASANYDGTAKTVTVSLKSPYTGMGAVTVKYDGAAEAVDAKTYTVTVDVADGTNFNAATDLALGSFTINPKSISGVTVTGIESNGYEFDNTAKTPEVTVKDGSATLIKDTDYTVAYTNNTNVGIAVITITGTGNYTGIKTVTFQITKTQPKKDIDYTVTLPASPVYDGTAKAVVVDKTNVNIGNITVRYNGSTVAPVNAGTYTVTVDISETANYAAMTNVACGSFTIAAKSIADVDVAEIAALTYNGREQTPAVTVKDGTKTLYNGTDYTVAYTNNKNAGTATITITGKGNYDSTTTKTVNFTINKAALIVKAANQTIGYGSALNTANVQVTYTGFVPGEGTANLNGALAFDTTYDTTSAVGGSYTVTPKGWSSDNYSITFEAGNITVTAKNLNDADVTVEEIAALTYNGTAQTPAPVVKNGSITLVAGEGKDYTIAYSNNLNAGTATVTITGIGNYVGTRRITFTINKITAELVWSGHTALVYDGQAKDVTAAITNLAATDADQVSVVVTNGKQMNAGTYTATATGLTGAKAANYQLATPAPTQEYTIAAKSIEGVDVAEIAALTYNGREQTPAVTVKDGTKTLYNGTDYTVAYTNNKNAGTATITITGKGNYDSATTKTVNFTINKAALTVKAANQTIGYGSELNTDNVQVTYTGFVGGESTTNLGGALAFETTYTTSSAVGGSYTVTPKGWTSDNYTITFEAGNITVTAKNLNDADVTVEEIAALTYNGTAQTPAPVVKNGSITLVAGEGKDYTIAYSNNINAGTATVTITGIGNYAGVRNVTFRINQIAAELVWSGYTSLVYDGQAKDVTAAITNLAATDAGQVNVVVTNGKQMNAGTYTATATGLTGAKAANYKLATPAPTQEYTIAAKSIAGVGVAEIAALTYNGREQTPAVTVKDGSRTLTNGVDYTVAYADNQNAGTATITITGKGNYDSATTKTVNFTINKAALTVKAANQTIGYGSELNTDNVQVTYTGFVNGETTADLGGALAFDTTYTATSAVGGEYTVTPKGWTSGNYVITFEAGNITVTAKNLADADVVVEVTGTYTYKAAEQDPTYTVKNNGVALVKDTDFTAVVSNNINAGTATITLSGKGNYTGTKTATFTIDKKEVGLNWTGAGTLYYDGEAQSVTAEATGVETADEGKVTVVVAGGNKVEVGSYTAAATGLTGEKAANYKLPAANTANYEIVTALAEVTVTPGTITATINGLTIKLVGYKEENETITVQGGGQTAADGKLTVNGVEYTVDASGVVVNESNATLEEVTPTVSKQDGATIEDAVVNGLAPAVDGLKEAVAQAVLSAAKANAEIAEVEVSLKVEGISYDAGVLKLDVTAVVTYKDTNGDPVGAENQVLPNSQIKAPITVQVKLPVGMPTTNLFAKHALGNGRFEYLSVSVDGSGVASWQQSSFSEVELISDARTATVTYNFNNGTAQTITYTAADLGKALPSDTSAGSTFNGWTFSAGAAADAKYTAMTDELLTALSGLTVTAESQFTAAAGGGGGGGAVIKKDEEVKNPFEDVFESDYYYDAVLWAVEQGITTGVTEDTFVPGAACNRGQMVTFLWREAGKPEPKSTVNPFSDVSEDAYYYKAVLWAVEQGITNGVTADSFAPGQACTRAQMATFLWRAAGKKDSSFENVFVDVKNGAYYYDAVLWAAERGITLGKTETTFVPNDACTRGQMVTFLYRNAKAGK